jgi:hypothetical protein
MRYLLAASIASILTGANAIAPNVILRGENYKVIPNNQSFSDALAGTEFRQVLVSGGPVIHKLHLETTVPGTEFTVTGAPSITGTAAADFTISINTGVATPYGSALQLDLKFDPSATGARFASISIPNDDPDDNPYVILVSGEGVDTPPAPQPDLSLQFADSPSVKLNRRTGTAIVKGKLLIRNDGGVASDFLVFNIYPSSDRFLNLAEDNNLVFKQIRGLAPIDPSHPKLKKFKFKLDTGLTSGTVFVMLLPGEAQSDENYSNNIAAGEFALSP